MGGLWIGFFLPSCRQNGMGSWCHFRRDTAGWGGSCNHWMPVEKVQGSSKPAQSLINEKLWKYIEGSESWKKIKYSNSTVKTACVPMGKTCEVGASSWGPQHQLTDAGRSRRYTTTRPHPEKSTINAKKCWAVHLFKDNVVMLRCTELPNLRKTTEDYTMRGDPIFGLMFN